MQCYVDRFACLTATLILAAACIAPNAHATPTTGSDYSATGVATMLGLVAESLVIADVSTAQATASLAALHGESGLRNQLCDATAVADASAELVSQFESALADHPEDSSLALGYQQAAAQLQTAQTQRSQALQALRELANASFDAAQIERLANWRQAATCQVPAEFRALTRTGEQWREIERALRAEERAVRLGNSTLGPQAQLLAELRADPLVVAARLRLQSQLGEMQENLASLTGQFAAGL